MVTDIDYTYRLEQGKVLFGDEAVSADGIELVSIHQWANFKLARNISLAGLAAMLAHVPVSSQLLSATMLIRCGLLELSRGS